MLCYKQDNVIFVAPYTRKGARLVKALEGREGGVGDLKKGFVRVFTSFRING